MATDHLSHISIKGLNKPFTFQKNANLNFTFMVLHQLNESTLQYLTNILLIPVTCQPHNTEFYFSEDCFKGNRQILLCGKKPGETLVRVMNEIEYSHNYYLNERMSLYFFES